MSGLCPLTSWLPPRREICSSSGQAVLIFDHLFLKKLRTTKLYCSGWGQITRTVYAVWANIPRDFHQSGKDWQLCSAKPYHEPPLPATSDMLTEKGKCFLESYWLRNFQRLFLHVAQLLLEIKLKRSRYKAGLWKWLIMENREEEKSLIVQRSQMKTLKGILLLSVTSLSLIGIMGRNRWTLLIRKMF